MPKSNSYAAIPRNFGLIACLLFGAQTAWATINHNPKVTDQPSYQLELDFTVEEVDGDKKQNESGDLELLPPAGSSGGSNSATRKVKVTLTVDEKNSSSPTATDYFEVTYDGNAISELNTETGGTKTIDLTASDFDDLPKKIVLTLNGGTAPKGPFTVTLKNKCSSSSGTDADLESIKLEIPLGKSAGSGKAMNSLKLDEQSVSKSSFTPQAMNFKGYGSDLGNKVVGNPEVSKGIFLRMPQTETNLLAIDDATAALRFDLAGVDAGRYRLWARVKSENPSSLWVSANGTQDHDWSIAASAGWEWRLFDAGDVLDLAGGNHSLALKFRDPALDIDALVLTKDAGYTPVGFGDLPADGESFRLEAEEGVITVSSDPAKPKYMSLGAATLNAAGAFTVTGVVAGQHTLWVRVRTIPGAAPSLSLNVDGNLGSTNLGEHVNWSWVPLSGPNLNLVAGNHNLTLLLDDASGYEVAFDSVILTKDAAFTPNGLGTIPTDGESFRIEAENFALTGDFSVQAGNALTESGASYLVSASSTISGDGFVSMNPTQQARNRIQTDFQRALYKLSALPAGLGRTLWVRARRSSSSVTASTVWLRFNDRGDEVWDLNLPTTDVNWHWVSLGDARFDTVVHADGSLRFGLRDAGVDIDQWILTDNPGYTPSGVVSVQPSASYLTEAEDMAPSGNLRVIRDISQVKTGDFLMNIDVQNPESYKLNYYSSAAAGAPGTNGLYDVTGKPVLNTIEIKRVPDASGQNRNILRVSESSNSRDIEFRVSQDERVWELKKGDNYFEKLYQLPSVNDLGSSRLAVAQEALSRVNLGSGNVRVEDRRLRDTEASTQLRRDEIKLVNDFRFGERVVSEIEDPEGRNKATYYRYVEGLPGSSDARFSGHLQGKERSDGSWESYDYTEADGRVRESKVTAVYVNAANDAGEAEAKVTEYGYSSSGISLSHIDDYKKTVEKVKGVETRRSHYIKRYSVAPDSQIWQTRTIMATAVGAGWNDPSNLTTITTHIPEGTPFAGEVRSIEHEDGRLTLYTYALASHLGADCVMETTYDGYPANPTRPLPGNDGGQFTEGSIPAALANGTKTVTYRRIDTDRENSTQVTDIESGKTLSHYVWLDDPNSPDPHGRPTLRMNMLTGAEQKTQYYAGEGCTACAQDLIGSITDEQGITTVYGYDDQDRREFITRQGVTIWNIYDAAARILEIRRGPEGSAPAGFQIIEKNAYDLTGELVSRKVPGPNTSGALVETVWTHEELPTGGQKTTTTYPDNGTRTEITAADGKILEVYGTAVDAVRYEYGVDDGMEFTKAIRRKQTTPDNYVDTAEWTAEYQLMGRLKKTVYPDGSEMIYDYDSSGRLEKTIDPDDVTSLVTYNGQGERYQTAIDYDRNGFIDTGTSAQDLVTETESFVTIRTHGGTPYDVQRTISKAWTDTGLVSTSINDRSLDGRHSWSESLGRIIHSVTEDSDTSDGDWFTTITQPDGTYSVQNYTAGRLANTTIFDNADAQLASTGYTYDTLGRQETITDSRTGITTLSYYDNDVLESSLAPDPDGSGPLNPLLTEYYYDEMSRTTQVILPDSSTTHTAYNLKGQVVKTYGSQRNPTDATYDYAGRQKTLTTWQDFDQATGTGISGASVTSWLYDSQRGWLDRKQYNDGKGTDYTYTAAGRLATRTWARGRHTRYDYDQAGQLLHTRYFLNSSDDNGTNAGNDPETPDVSLQYDRLGRKFIESNGFATTSYAYDPATLAIDTETIAYDFDNNGTADFTRVLDRSQDSLLRDSGWQLKDGTTVENRTIYTYRATDGRLGTVGNGLETFTYGYTPNSSLLASVTGPAHAVTNTYEPSRDVLDTKVNRKLDTTVVSGYDYKVNALGQRTNVAKTGSAFDGARDIVWDYDLLGQVISADSTVPGLDRGYRYDMIGNRLKSADGTTNPDDPSATAYSPDANALNQYSVINDQSLIINPQYDFDGNMNEGPLPAQSGLSDLFWDAENRLISATLPDNTNVSYRYDAQSRRIAEWGDGLQPASSPPTTVYAYDGWNPIAEYGASYVLAKTYTWGMDLSGTMQGAGGVGGLLSVTDGTGTYYPTYDGNGNISEYLDATGSVVAHYEYDPFGKTIVASEAKAQDFAHRFSTKPLDVTTGLYYYGYRYYDPVTGRWPSRDPIGERGGVNLYLFVYNIPLDWVDDLGNKPKQSKQSKQSNWDNKNNHKNNKNRETTEEIGKRANENAGADDSGPENDSQIDNIISDILDDPLGGGLSNGMFLAAVKLGKNQCSTKFAASGLKSGCACCRFSVKSWKMLHGGADPIQSSALSAPSNIHSETKEKCVPPSELPPGTPTIGAQPGFGQYDIKFEHYAIPF